MPRTAAPALRYPASRTQARLRRKTPNSERWREGVLLREGFQANPGRYERRELHASTVSATSFSFIVARQSFASSQYLAHFCLGRNGLNLARKT